MPDRKTFLAAGIAAAAALGANAEAQTAAPAASPSPAPPATPAPPPSAAAAALAASMRRFDPALTDTDVTSIANDIDARIRRGARLNPDKGTFLKNGDEPITRFAAEPAPQAAR